MEVRDDASDQAVWRQFYKRVFELPVGFNSFRKDNLTREQWAQVAVAHDMNLQRKGSWRGNISLWMRALNAEAHERVAGLSASLDRHRGGETLHWAGVHFESYMLGKEAVYI